jgi:hypothetical protein
MIHKKLTQSQLSIMKTLWAENKAMIASDFVQLDPSLNLNSVQSSLRSLFKKIYIEVSDIVYSGKVLTRSYVPTIHYDKICLHDIFHSAQASHIGILFAIFIASIFFLLYRSVCFVCNYITCFVGEMI